VPSGKAAQVAARDDTALTPLCADKRRSGKHLIGAVGAVAHKLVQIICYLSCGTTSLTCRLPERLPLDST